jgi:hypothetical protein
MLDVMDWLFGLLAPISGLVVFVAIVGCLLGLSFVISFVIAKFEP